MIITMLTVCLGFILLCCAILVGCATWTVLRDTFFDPLKKLEDSIYKKKQ